ncbi:MAG: AAA family ATPase [Lachnospiraceae bacterium]|nr:AAA family ATPase [Lachnospiraceae bacterium]
MIINELTLAHFGKFHGKVVKFDNGLNILHGKNEAGKSTIHTFIYCMFFGMDNRRGAGAPNLYKQYEPWEDQGGYGGSLTFTSFGKQYKIERSFLRPDPWVKLTNVTDGVEVVPAQEHINTLLGNMTETAFRNMVSLGQMKATFEEGLAEELKNHVASLGSSKNVEIDLEHSLESLYIKRESIEKKRVEVAENQRKNLMEALAESDRRMDELAHREKDLKQKLAGDRKQEYDMFQEQRTFRSQTEEELRDIKDQMRRLEHEQTRWKNEADSWTAKTGLKTEKLEQGKKPKSLRGLVIVLYVLLTACLGGGAFFLSDYLISYFNGTDAHFDFSIVLGPALLGGALVLLGLVLLISHGARRRRRAYRMYEERMASYKDAKNSYEELSAQQTSLSEKISDIEGSDYMKLHEANNDLEKEILRCSWEQEQEQQHMDDLGRELTVMEEICARNAAYSVEIGAIDLAVDTVKKVAKQIRESFGNKLNKKVGEYMAVISGGLYSDIIIDENFDIFIKTEEEPIPVSQLSRGTIEQVYFCLRLAAADMMWPELNPPIILDDTFAYYDDKRTYDTLLLLRHLRRQVIILTCQGREKEFLKDM